MTKYLKDLCFQYNYTTQYIQQTLNEYFIQLIEKNKILKKTQKVSQTVDKGLR